ncbi:DUF2680 domain-containing protein [Neobacillus mesonae]|uniref:DUF2680 domain-containing protein n=1 Tax=Neobacillus mesonae TaxID=1193713 RepID=UPI00203D1AE1|nr:DUF2680 domain-containing protein [Neobacillus mesonae]MCM3568036.1 DUF2680 domain-containing protein [Neobacillus mesonae]
MRKKFLVVVLFFLSYSLMPFQSFAESNNKKMNEKEKMELDYENSNPKQPEYEIDMDSIDKLGPFNQNDKIIDSDLNCTKDIPYTLAQKQRLDQIYHRIYMDYLALIETYAWAGALTQDQKLLRYKMLRNYVLTFPKRNYKWCSEYEEDEWEEEWFNSDND